MSRESADRVLPAYDVRGAGPETIVFSNALATTAEVWRPQIDAALAKGLRVLTYDHPGHGASPARTGAFLVQDMAGDVVTLLDALQISHAHVCGISLGGLIAQELAIGWPERVRSLALVATASSFPPSILWNERASDAHEYGMASVADAHIERWFTERTRRERPEIVEAFRGTLLQVDPIGYANCCFAVRDADTLERLSSIVAPTTIVAGSCDVATPPARSEEIASKVPNARYTILPNVSHFPTVEAADAVNAVLLDRFVL